MFKNDFDLLLSLNDDIAAISEYFVLFAKIFDKINAVFDTDLCGLSLFNENRDKLGCLLVTIPFRRDTTKWHRQFAIDSLPSELFGENSVITKVESEIFYNMGKFEEGQIDISEILEKKKISNLFFVPMHTGGKSIGYIILPISDYITNKENDNYLFRLSNLIASAIKNTEYVTRLKHKEEEKDMLLKLFSLLLDIKDENNFYMHLAEAISNLIPFEYIGIIGRGYNKNESEGIYITKDETGKLKVNKATRNDIRIVESFKFMLLAKDGIVHTEITGEELLKMCSQFSHIRQIKEKNSIVSLLVFRYMKNNLGELFLTIGRKEHVSQANEISIKLMHNSNSYFTGTEIEFCENLLPQLISIFANFYSFKEIEILTKKLEQEKHYLLDEINSATSFQEIVGNSVLLNNILNKIKLVAPLDATVLVTGETGTGKELIARAIHKLSKRNEQAYITINCAALPVQLIESELFGHEKGSFTGAFEKKFGKFEIANKGTIFLDEIGELPLEVQSKLLRVLQEKEFERVGGKSTVYSDVRIIAATNRNLEKEIEQGKFRSDLFFRLNVFPIEIPPLRERADDIPLLVKHFIQNYSKKIGKDIKSIKKNDLEMLTQYNWPGNIRELEHVIERAIIISQGSKLSFENFKFGGDSESEAKKESFKSLIEIEKDHIINALKLANGKVTGANSAALLLKINGKTLGTRMRKLGIKRKDIISDSKL
ncbi:MAG: sigma 54-interacting transcriptional regulator [Ignavibacteriales bacterium]|nr:sigma 54-interacting transcriptional regulator [Ignavibacteriales bacterium]